jgi:branched-chain amino acid transport system substrate-binding protein
LWHTVLSGDHEIRIPPEHASSRLTVKRTLAALLLSLAQWAYAQTGAQPAPFAIAGAVSTTGPLAEYAAEYRRGLLLWLDEVSAAGGLAGRVVELRLEDDQSDALETRRIYERLAREPDVDLLIGPYGSAASASAAAAAERARRVLVNATAAAGAAQSRGGRYVFQVAAPYADYGAGALEIARDSGLRRLMVLSRGDLASQEAAEGLRRRGLAGGFDVLPLEVFGATARDFTAQVGRAQAAGTEAWIAFGQARDAAEMVKTFKRLGYAPRLFVAQGAADPAFIELVGQDAEYAIGVSPYERRAATRGNAEFVRAYAARWAASPGLAAAQGYAAGKLIEEAVARAPRLDAETLRAAFAALQAETPLGAYAVDPASGAQRAARPLLVQIIKGRREIVWPARYATARPTLPYPEWKTRRPIGE